MTEFRTANPVTKQDMPKSLYVHRALINAADLIAWATEQGFGATVQASDMHVTVAFSRVPVDWFGFGGWAPEKIEVAPGGARAVTPLGDKGAIVLRFASSDLEWRWRQFCDGGASWDHDGYHPHVTITYQGGDIDLSKVEPYQGELIFGHEVFQEVKEDWQETITEKSLPRAMHTHGVVTKIDDEQKIAYGWFSVIEEGGQPVVDTQGDIITEPTLIKAVHGFILDSRAGKLMHNGQRVADVVDSIVFAKDLQKALGVDLGKVGWFGGMKFRDDAIWQRVKSGELPAFSIGGYGKRKPV